jgi:hypothetical protein
MHLFITLIIFPRFLINTLIASKLVIVKYDFNSNHKDKDKK